MSSDAAGAGEVPVQDARVTEAVGILRERDTPQAHRVANWLEGEAVDLEQGDVVAALKHADIVQVDGADSLLRYNDESGRWERFTRIPPEKSGQYLVHRPPEAVMVVRRDAAREEASIMAATARKRHREAIDWGPHKPLRLVPFEAVANRFEVADVYPTRRKPLGEDAEGRRHTWDPVAEEVLLVDESAGEVVAREEIGAADLRDWIRYVRAPESEDGLGVGWAEHRPLGELPQPGAGPDKRGGRCD